MSDIDMGGEFATRLKNESFLRFVDNSRMGVLIIQRGYLKYFNKQFMEIFGYTSAEILKWKKREFYKMVHPEDLSNLVKYFRIQADKKTVTVRFRGVRKDGEIIPIENYICHIYYDNKTAYLSSYIQLENPIEERYLPNSINIKEKRKILLDYDPNIIRFLEDNNLKFEIVRQWLYQIKQ